MIKSISGFLVIAVLAGAGFAVSVPQPAQAASCTSTLNTCISRCKKDVPDDKSCPSDHCYPKFETCKSSGCWQQGARYGNVLTCNLQRK